jgi:hypothetical protein
VESFVYTASDFCTTLEVVDRTGVQNRVKKKTRINALKTSSTGAMPRYAQKTDDPTPACSQLVVVLPHASPSLLERMDRLKTNLNEL